MSLWLAVQPPGVLLLLGAFVTLMALGAALTAIRLFRYWQWARSAEQRRQDFVVAAVAATLAAGAAAAAITGPPAPADDAETIADLQQGRVGYGD
ncbi:hypothetical protein [Stenotrophomonas maltophilia]|uniref:hypothetical protein n=1 Tax=Stenotrophomonas maltophilia TaxID=40324 RepID=UPI001F1E6ED3|nr:hypothetical protein [Stenotrophomonas maltophilia]MCF3498198.1 hypothetical protein [Stenotrophomonas maltophilia]